MRALNPEVINVVWTAVEALLPEREDNHPLRCHNPRIADRVCFRGILVRLVTGCSWTTAEYLLGGAVSDTTLRARRDEWVAAGVFDAQSTQRRTRNREKPLTGPNPDGNGPWQPTQQVSRWVGPPTAVGRSSVTSVDGSQHKAPSGGPGTGKNPCDRAKSGWKWSLAADAAGIPLGWATDGANRHDSTLFEATLDSVASRGLTPDIGTLHLDRAYDSQPIRDQATARGITDINCPKRRKRGAAPTKQPTPLGMRWTIERTNSWLTNYGQLRRNTDRHPQHRLAQLALAITLIITIKLIDWRNRWSPTN